MRAWIDEQECIGSGLCPMIEPLLFELGEDGVSRMRDAAGVRPPGPDGATDVPAERSASASRASKACPVGAIHLD